ncbi:conserved exported hypothetical protein [Candidatus Sulfotelmatomonas gaucii]|uniref:Lipocalin-like domain-containing protein n=1 Tax=Candidatus Sulfuritelmatomonas gaucii TaxID=2043161 RepID=A0A2N9LMP4_9BACT|nr:conserved exported hypothetical protein [Candidatus Sulfotelmatomonas gaucii]
MNQWKRYVAGSLFLAAALCVAAVSHAQSPFDGTWQVNLAQTKFSPKPLSFYISQGWYHCTGSCNPAYDVAADGQDHAVTGHAYDSISVTIVDPHTIFAVAKKGGAVMFEQTRTVSADGKTLTVKTTDHPMDGSAATTFETVAKRSGVAASGVHAASGNWVITKQSGSGNGLVTTYKMDGDQLTMTAGSGESYSAKLDGSDYPVKNAYGWDAVSLKKINDHSIEETDKRGGTVTDVSTMTVAAGGKTMTVVDNDKLSNRTSTYVATKQK